MRKIICISHLSDADGLASAALVRMARGADVKLVDYSNFIKILKTIKDAAELYICDLGLSPETYQPFFNEVNRIKQFAKVTYIDHHPKVNGYEYISTKNLSVIHSLEDCTAALTYDQFKDVLPKGASIIAAYAALTDYLENGPIASKILLLHDRTLVYYEASMLAYAVERLGGSSRKLRDVVDGLSRLKYPHEIKHVAEAALQQARRVSTFLKKVGKEGKVKGRYAYINSRSFPKGAAANLVRYFFGTPVGVAYALKDNSSFAELSLRASEDYPYDLGLITQRLASKLGGFGGGHPKASGARIPKGSLQQFLQELDALL